VAWAKAAEALRRVARTATSTRKRLQEVRGSYFVSLAFAVLNRRRKMMDGNQKFENSLEYRFVHLFRDLAYLEERILFGYGTE